MKTDGFFTSNITDVDPLISDAIDNEVARQTNGLELIASENFVSEAVLQAMGTVLRTSMPRVIRANVITADANSRMLSSRPRSTGQNRCSGPNMRMFSRIPELRRIWLF